MPHFVTVQLNQVMYGQEALIGSKVDKWLSLAAFHHYERQEQDVFWCTKTVSRLPKSG